MKLMGEEKKAVSNYRKSADLNNVSAQEWLIENGYP